MAADRAFLALFLNSVEFFKQDREILATVVAMVVNRRLLFESRVSEKRETQPGHSLSGSSEFNRYTRNQ